jgi:hypothetical protein
MICYGDLEANSGVMCRIKLLEHVFPSCVAPNFTHTESLYGIPVSKQHNYLHATANCACALKLASYRFNIQ